LMSVLLDPSSNREIDFAAFGGSEVGSAFLGAVFLTELASLKRESEISSSRL